jgi:hypothetical protein
VTENPCSLLGGGEIFFFREEQPRVDETILSTRGDTKLKPKKVLVLFRSELFTSFMGKTILIMQILRKAGATIFLLFLYARALITSFQKMKCFKGIVRPY